MIEPISLPHAMRENRRLRKEGAAASSLSVGLVSNVVLTDVDTFVENGLLNAGVDPSFSHGDYGQIADSIAAMAREDVEHIGVVLHVDAMAENLPWTAASWSWEQVHEIVDFRLSELRGALDEAPAALRLHVAAFAGGGQSHPSWSALRRAALTYVEQEVRALAGQDSRVLWADVQTLLDEAGTTSTLNATRAAHYSAPLLPAGEHLVGSALASSILAALTPPRKVLVLDADNTLWGGVLGEDGLANIALHPTVYPGNVYFRAQSLYRGIKERGALLAVVSKNEPADLLAALNDHPYSQLKETDFVAVKAGWGPKAESIAELADELNLGMDSFVFVDDSEVETASVREQLPVGAVIRVPDEPGAYLDVLPAVAAQFPGDGAGLGDRTEKYRVRAAAASLEKSASSREDFLAGLQTRLVVSVDDATQVARVSELSERTNQFNASLNRYTTGEVEQLMAADDWRVVTYDVSDRFGSSGVSAAAVVAIGAQVRLEGWWISCRVLGRGVERAVLRHLCGPDGVDVVFRPGPRNQQVQNLLDELGDHTEEDGQRIYRVPVDFDDADGKWVEVLADGSQ